MSDDTTIPDSEQRSIEDLLSDLCSEDVGNRIRAHCDIQRRAIPLARQVVALRAQVAAHEDADRRWSADLRAVEAERDELRRDYGDLIALDAEGLRARIVELEDAASQYKAHLEAAHAETMEYRRWWQDATAELTARNDSADVVVAAEERKRLEAMLDEAYRENEADREEFDRAVGQPVADRIAEHRHTIRQLTHRLNEALAAMDKAGAK